MSWSALVSEFELGEVWSDKLFGSSRIAKLWLSKDPTVEGGESKEEWRSECSGLSGELELSSNEELPRRSSMDIFPSLRGLGLKGLYFKTNQRQRSYRRRRGRGLWCRVSLNCNCVLHCQLQLVSCKWRPWKKPWNIISILCIRISWWCIKWIVITLHLKKIISSFVCSMRFCYLLFLLWRTGFFFVNAFSPCESPLVPKLFSFPLFSSDDGLGVIFFFCFSVPSAFSSLCFDLKCHHQFLCFRYYSFFFCLAAVLYRGKGKNFVPRYWNFDP